MKMYYAKVAVFVDDELCERELYDLIPVLANKVRVDGEYIEREFGIAVRVLWNSLTDATHTLNNDEMEAIKSLFGKKKFQQEGPEENAKN